MDHATHVELSSGTGGYYVWCEDCDFDAGRTTVAVEAESRARAHESDYGRLVADLVLVGATQEQAETRALRLLAGENA
jgi:hypothetical protein